MTEKRKKTGVFGEEAAAGFLKQKGYQILYRNFRCKLGEIDIVARDGDVTVFIEVRTCRNDRYGSPIESILWKKQKKLITLANIYIQKFGLENDVCRFDVISVMRRDGFTSIKLIKDAFWEV